MNAPKEIFLNISDEPEMPPLDEIDWSEVGWTADRPALRQALLYVILEDRDSIIAKSYEKDAEIERLKKEAAGWKRQADWPDESRLDAERARAKIAEEEVERLKEELAMAESAVEDLMEVTNNGGFPVKNANYWKRQHDKCQAEIERLKAEVKEWEQYNDALTEKADCCATKRTAEACIKIIGKYAFTSSAKAEIKEKYGLEES